MITQYVVKGIHQHLGRATVATCITAEQADCVIIAAISAGVWSDLQISVKSEVDLNNSEKQLAKNNMIQAIKDYRIRTQCSLRDALNTVEQYRMSIGMTARPNGAAPVSAQ